MAQINYPQNPVKVECDDSVKNVTIWFEYNNRITISNHEERVATGKSQYILVNDGYIHYNVIEPYEFSENDKLTLTGNLASGQFSVRDASKKGGTYKKD